jgi:hypothetical protein
MKCKWLLMSVLSTLAIAVVTADPAFARDKHKNQPRCVPNKPYGCAPPVYSYGKYIGQDPDLNIRFQMYRDPTTGYYAYP